MRAYRWLCVIVGLSLAAGVTAAPVVTNCLPQEGETVQPGQVHVELEFSEPMRDGVWSIVAADRGETPKIVQGPEYITPQILILEVQTEPGKLYGIGFNSATKHNFVSEAGEPLEPFVIHFRTAGGAAGDEDGGGDAEEAGDQTPGLDQPVEDDGGDVPAPDAQALRPTWRPGETQERIATVERTLTNGEGARKRESYTRIVRTSALQVTGLKGGQITRAVGKMIKAERNRKGTTGAEAPMEEVPVPDLVLEAWLQNRRWSARAHGGEAPDGALQSFVDAVACGSPFAPPKPVALNQTWKLEDQALRAALDLLGSDAVPDGSVTCRFAAIGEIKTRDGKKLRTAEITHAWTAGIMAGTVPLRLKGSGKTIFLLDAGKFISTEIRLSGESLGAVGDASISPAGKASMQVTQRLRYFAQGQYPELLAGGAPDGEMGQIGTDEGGRHSLVGLWVFRSPELALVLDAKPDGTYHRMLGSAEGNEEEDGTYRTGEGWLEITPRGGEAMRLNLKFVDGKTIEITDDTGDGLRLVRQDLEGGGDDGQAPPDNGGVVPPDEGGAPPPDNGGGMGPDDDPWAELGGDGGEGMEPGPGPAPDNGGGAPPGDGGGAPPDNGGGAPPDNGGGMGPDDDPWGMFEGGGQEPDGQAPDAAPDAAPGCALPLGGPRRSV